MIPVPIVTVNHDGVKLMIRSRQCHLVVQTSRADLPGVATIVTTVVYWRQYARSRNDIMYSRELQPEKRSHLGMTFEAA